jgi:hypothetical protein
MAALILFALLLVPGLAQATPIHYTITYTVDTLNGTPPPPGTFKLQFEPPIELGEVFTGSFDIDSADVIDTGLTLVTIRNFFTEIHGITWDQNSPGAAFSGFRCCGGFVGPMASPNQNALFAGGILVALNQGVFGLADVPFIDLFLGAPFTPPSTAGRFNVADLSVTGASGSYTLALTTAAVPGPMALLALGAGMLVLRLRRGWTF